MNKLFEQLFYKTGFNLSFYNTDTQLDYLKSKLPKSFLSRQVTDIGCGDGKVSLKLKHVLQPAVFTCLDVSPSLVASCRQKGLNAKVVDIEKQMFSGDLGILWGVIHHFSNPISTIKNISQSFNNLIIREPTNHLRLFESGCRYKKTTLLDILSKADVNIINQFSTPDKKAIILFTNNHN